VLSGYSRKNLKIMKNFNSYDQNTIEFVITQLEAISKLLKENAAKPRLGAPLKAKKALSYFASHGYHLSEGQLCRLAVECSIPFEYVRGKFIFDKDKFMDNFYPDILRRILNDEPLELAAELTDAPQALRKLFQ